jgi:integrase
MFASVILPRRVYNDNSGSFYEVPVVHTDDGYLDRLIDYVIENRAKSTTWKRKLAFAVQLLLEYMHANPQERNSELLFNNFANKLQTGTFEPTTGHDPSRLGWVARTPDDAQQIINRISDFLEYLNKDKPSIVTVNPRVPLSSNDRAVHECAEFYRRKFSLLGHLWKPPSDSDSKRRNFVKRGPKVSAEPPAFPEERFDELMERGFKVGGRINYRDQAITLLMHGAGFRISEPMHLYIGDVTRDPTNHLRAQVRLHHPTLGEAPTDLLDERGAPIRCKRDAYLLRKFGLMPRIDLMSKKEAGWKGVVLDERYYMRPYWFRPDFAEQFMYVWNKYMEEVADIPLKQRRHPFAFMNINREPKGSIYSLGKFETSHGRACERIGLVVAKRLGTTPHGHRHGYGRRLTLAGFDPAFIKKCMHHSTEQSQEVYTGLTTRETLLELEAGFQRMQASANQ